MGVTPVTWQLSPDLVVVQRINRGVSPHEVPDGALADYRP